MARPALGARLRRLPPVVWAVTGLWTALLLGASLLWPPDYGYDEPQHLDMVVVYAAHPFTFYGPGELLTTQSGVAIQNRQPGFPPSKPLNQVPIEPRSARPSIDELGGATIVPTTLPNQMIQHPPLYYELGALVLHAPGVSGLAFDVQIWLLRLLSVLLMVPVPAFAWAAARRLVTEDPDRGGPAAVPVGDGLARVVPIAALVLPLTIPNLVRDGSSISNDSLLILSMSALCWGLVRVVTGDLGRRTAVWVALALAVGLWTKGFALVMPPVVAAAYVVGAWRAREAGSGWRGLVRVGWAPFLVAVAGGLVGAVWWVRNLVRYGTVQINGLGPEGMLKIYGQPDGKGRATEFFPAYLTELFQRVYGGIGLPDTPSLGAPLMWGWLTLLATGLLAALLVRGRRGERLTAVVLLAAVVLTLCVTTYGGLSQYEKYSRGVSGAQGRYLYHLVVLLAAFAAVGWARALRPQLLPRLVPWILGAGLLTNVVAWVFVLQGWYASPTTSVLSTFLASVAGFNRWSPVPPQVNALLVVVLPVVTGIVALLLVRREGADARRAAAGLPGA